MSLSSPSLLCQRLSTLKSSCVLLKVRDDAIICAVKICESFSFLVFWIQVAAHLVLSTVLLLCSDTYKMKTFLKNFFHHKAICRLGLKTRPINTIEYSWNNCLQNKQQTSIYIKLLNIFKKKIYIYCFNRVLFIVVKFHSLKKHFTYFFIFIFLFFIKPLVTS